MLLPSFFKKHKFLLLFISILSIAYSQDSEIRKTAGNDNSTIKVMIELANPRIYRQNDEIIINIKIFNNSDADKIMLIAKDKRYSFDFKMATMQNRQQEHSKDYIISFHKVQPVFNSDVRLRGGEGFIYEARLNDYFDLNTAGQFFIQCLFYPELKLNDSSAAAVISNQLSVNIRPKDVEEEILVKQDLEEKEKRLQTEKMPPDDVISYMLNARMKGEWDKFFLYLDLGKLILTNNNFKEKFLKSDIEKQEQLKNEYKKYLMQNVIQEISFVPTKYEIVRTQYAAGIAQVEVIEYFKYQDYNEKKYYTYFLSKKGNIWYVYSYEVLNLSLQ